MRAPVIAAACILFDLVVLTLPLLVDAVALALQALEAASTNSPCLLPRRCLVYLADKESRQTPHKHKSEEGDAAVVELRCVS